MSTIISAAASPIVGKALGAILVAVCATSPGWLPVAAILAFSGH